MGNGANACAGGIGGRGGGGGGGAGGLSAGLLYKGTPPSLDGASTPAADQHPGITIGEKGLPGMKGLGGEAAQTTAPVSKPGADGSPGADGDARAVLAAP